MIEDAQKVVENNNPTPYYSHYKLFEKDFWGPLTDEIKNFCGLRSSVLDLGCGYGTMAILCRLWGLDVVCVDGGGPSYVSKTLLDNYRIPYINCNLENEEILLNEEFDAIVSTEVIEHIDKVKNYLEQIKKHLKVGGRLFLSTPDADSTWGYEAETASGHVHHYNIGEIRELFKDFNIIRLESCDVAYEPGRKHIYLIAEKK
jgi:2-polyprenyl-3-methyl-5-hydroxy-6-metoxy-1,4-benzoquinol methylase